MGSGAWHPWAEREGLPVWTCTPSCPVGRHPGLAALLWLSGSPRRLRPSLLLSLRTPSPWRLAPGGGQQGCAASRCQALSGKAAQAGRLPFSPSRPWGLVSLLSQEFPNPGGGSRQMWPARHAEKGEEGLSEPSNPLLRGSGHPRLPCLPSWPHLLVSDWTGLPAPRMGHGQGPTAPGTPVLPLRPV